MGHNWAGQLGDGTLNDTNRPKQIVSSGVKAIAVGEDYSMFTKSDGSLWGMGYNGNGQIGDGTYNSTAIPKQVIASGVAGIAVGNVNTYFLGNGGDLWGMGDNRYGQLGNANYSYFNCFPVQILGPYNRIIHQLLSSGNIRLSFVGVANMGYALDRSSTLISPNWSPQATNPADSIGVLVFTNTPNPTAANFWRIRSVP